MGQRVIQIFGLCLLFRLVLCWTHFNDALYEGSTCKLPDNSGDGVCVIYSECPSVVADFKKGIHNRVVLCSYVHDIPIVCCSVPHVDTNTAATSRSESACQEYGKTRGNFLEVGYHILRGTDARLREFPQIAALGYNASDESDGPVIDGLKYTCGGTLISPRHVLTAAHCVSNIEESVPIEVRLGSTDLKQNQDTTQRVPIESIIPHEGYKRSQRYHDIAIIKLKESVIITDFVRPACLMTKPIQNYDFTGNKTLVVAGWGITELLGDPSTILKKAAGFTVVKREDCIESFSKVPQLPNGLDNNVFCAIDQNRSRKADTCQGDSGGPIFITSESATPLLAGITAFGTFCGGSTPSVYTSVYHYLDWIEEQVWPSFEQKKSSGTL